MLTIFYLYVIPVIMIDYWNNITSPTDKYYMILLSIGIAIGYNIQKLLDQLYSQRKIFCIFIYLLYIIKCLILNSKTVVQFRKLNLVINALVIVNFHI